MSIAVACPHCEAKLNVRDEMAGRRGKCPKCERPIDIPANTKPAEAPPAAASAALTPDQIAATVRAALASLTIKPPGKAGTTALVCQLTRVVHFVLPLLFGGALAYHVIFNGSWATGTAGTPGPLAYYVLLGLGIVLTVMSVLSHFGPARPRPAPGVPLDDKKGAPAR